MLYTTLCTPISGKFRVSFLFGPLFFLLFLSPKEKGPCLSISWNDLFKSLSLAFILILILVFFLFFFFLVFLFLLFFLRECLLIGILLALFLMTTHIIPFHAKMALCTKMCTMVLLLINQTCYFDIVVIV